MFAQRYIASIMAFGLLLGTSVAFAAAPSSCQLSPQVQQKVSHLPMLTQQQVRVSFHKGCREFNQLTDLIHDKQALLNAEMLQPKVDTKQVKQLASQINQLQTTRLKRIIKTNQEIADISNVRVTSRDFAYRPRRLPQHL